MRARDRAFQVTPEAFDLVRAGTVRGDMLPTVVVDGYVLIAKRVEEAVATKLVGRNRRSGQHVRLN